MSFQYKNPISGTLLNGPDSVALDNPQGTNFSVLSIGGYMEVYSHQDLIYDPIGPGGSVTNSANTIPIEFAYNEPFSVPDQVYVNSDEISTGRRRLGMLVYVITADTTYQLQIDNYATLWNAAETSGALAPSGDNYICTNGTVAGQNFVNAWTGSTIEGVNGVLRANARWRVFTTGASGGGSLSVSDGVTTVTSVTGLTVSGGTVTSGGTGLAIIEFTGGTSGSSGTSGSNGTDGSSGTSGSNGTDGSSGTSGSNGTDGSSGTSGSSGTDGSSGTSGSNGTDG